MNLSDLFLSWSLCWCLKSLECDLSSFVKSFLINLVMGVRQFLVRFLLLAVSAVFSPDDSGINWEESGSFYFVASLTRLSKWWFTTSTQKDILLCFLYLITVVMLPVRKPCLSSALLTVPLSIFKAFFDLSAFLRIATVAPNECSWIMKNHLTRNQKLKPNNHRNVSRNSEK
jgi:hypothetical protein